MSCCKKKRSAGGGGASRLSQSAGGFLQRISVGKYDQGLYLNETRHQASVWGGLFTILMATIILGYMSVLFYTIFKRADFTVVESSTLFEKSGILDQTVWDIHTQLPQQYSIDLNQVYGFKDCSDITFGVAHEEIQIPIKNTSFNEMGKNSMRCNYDLTIA